MNIFFLDRDPIKAAKYHGNKHCVKMILEYAQLMSTAHHVLGSSIDADVLYRKTHMNHPSAIWVRQSAANYQWLYSLFCAVCDEYTFRYGKVHKTDQKLREILSQLPTGIPVGKFSQPPQAMPEDCHCKCSVTAYRKYYMTHKAHIAEWKYRRQPVWFKEN